MQVLPVIDLKAGCVVHAVAGDRTRYQPVSSSLTADPAPGAVARALVSQFGFREVYVADLDALEGARPDWESYRAIAAAGLRLTLDPGASSSASIEQLRDWNRNAACLARLVVPSEKLTRLAGLPRLVAAAGGIPVTFSLDRKRGKWLGAGAAAWSGKTPLDVARDVVDHGLRSLIVLDLGAVGTSLGPLTLDICRAVRAAFPDLELISGGGIRDAADLQAFHAAGCSAVLVASALHTGGLTPQDVSRASRLA